MLSYPPPPPAPQHHCLDFCPIWHSVSGPIVLPLHLAKESQLSTFLVKKIKSQRSPFLRPLTVWGPQSWVLCDGTVTVTVAMPCGDDEAAVPRDPGPGYSICCALTVLSLARYGYHPAACSRHVGRCSGTGGHSYKFLRTDPKVACSSFGAGSEPLWFCPGTSSREGNYVIIL